VSLDLHGIQGAPETEPEDALDNVRENPGLAPFERTDSCHNRDRSASGGIVKCWVLSFPPTKVPAAPIATYDDMIEQTERKLAADLSYFASYFSEAISMTKRYFTSLLRRRS